MSRPAARSLFILLAFSLLVFAGCWTSKFTLIAPDKAKVDRAYVGDWDAVNSKGEHADLFIRNIDDHLYSVQTRDKGGDTNSYVGFIAEVKGATFAHLRPLTDDGSIPDVWMLMRVAIADNNGKLTLEQLNDKFFEGKTIDSPEQLRAVLEQNLNNEAMYAKDETITATRVAKK